MNIMQLLQQLGGQTGAQVPELAPIQGDPAPHDPIVVTAPEGGGSPRGGMSIDGPQPPLMGNKAYLQEAMSAMGDAPQRKGMFGTKGTLRDILGTLGDAFLVQSGNKTVYAPQREREKQADAMTGFTASPEAAMAAMERLAAAGYPEQAQELFEHVQRQALRQEQQQSLAAGREDLTETRKQKRLLDARNYVSRLMQSAGDDPERVQAAVQQATRVAQAAGLSLDDLGVSEGMTEAERAVYAAGDMTVNQQVQVPFTERRTAVAERGAATQERNADTAEHRAQSQRISATRPRAAPQPRNEIDSDKAIRIGNTPVSQRSPGEQEWYERYHRPTRGSTRRTLGGSNSSTGTGGLRLRGTRPAN